jgi:hypothetical protein
VDRPINIQDNDFYYDPNENQSDRVGYENDPDADENVNN